MSHENYKQFCAKLRALHNKMFVASIHMFPNTMQWKASRGVVAKLQVVLHSTLTLVSSELQAQAVLPSVHRRATGDIWRRDILYSAENRTTYVQLVASHFDR
jgi:hypothetical protein